MNQPQQHHMEDIGFKQVRPSPQLRPFVQWFWAIESNGPVLDKRQEFMHPDGSLSLLFNWGDALQMEDGRYPQTATFHQIRPHSQLMTLTGNIRAFGILFRPGGAYPFFGIPMYEIASGNVVYKDQLSQLNEQLAQRSTFNKKIMLAETWLMRLLSREHTPSQLIPASINLINYNLGKQPIHEVAQNVYVSERQLERLYKKEVGLSPKKYARLVRLHHARNAIKQAKMPNLSEIALHTGFYDQAHFNREFKNSIGITPSAYIARQDERRS